MASVAAPPHTYRLGMSVVLRAQVPSEATDKVCPRTAAARTTGLWGTKGEEGV